MMNWLKYYFDNGGTISNLINSEKEKRQSIDKPAHGSQVLENPITSQSETVDDSVDSTVEETMLSDNTESKAPSAGDKSASGSTDNTEANLQANGEQGNGPAP